MTRTKTWRPLSVVAVRNADAAGDPAGETGVGVATDDAADAAAETVAEGRVVGLEEERGVTVPEASGIGVLDSADAIEGSG